MLPVRAVIFDLDDTLFDDAGCTLAGLRALAARHPALAALPDDALFARHAALLAALEGEVHAGRLSVEACRERRLAQLLSGVGVPDPDGAEAARTYHAASRAHYRPLPGALDVVQALRAAGVRVGVLTNYPGGVQRAKLDACGLTPHLHASVTTSDAPPKPHPDSYLRACAALDVQAGEAVMVGDNWRNDVAGAVSAGLRAAWFNPARRAAPAPAPHVALHGWTPLDGTLAALLSPPA
ncbi:HAD family hydrolase [Deinococcus aquiradiocola]|uniref:Haloacid dehalogenase n=1 Tax=Deinococcus aquiradiocola TaxID=393059 RepID=A0A917UUK7_9DEIO|nr:HAD-IA family hydrolase [Deinococcus aquiradiocola]GGJ86175.1 haloacid dehalogenase [Deinococcus aquiradiocola]